MVGRQGGQNKTWPQVYCPSIAICAMHAARTYIECYQVSRYGSYHAVNISHMYGTDFVPFLLEELRERYEPDVQTRSDKKHTGSYSLSSHYYINIINYRTHKPRQSKFVLENTTEALLVLDMASSVSRRMAHATHATLGGNIFSRPLPVPSHLIPPCQTMQNNNS